MIVWERFRGTNADHYHANSSSGNEWCSHNCALHGGPVHGVTPCLELVSHVSKDEVTIEGSSVLKKRILLTVALVVNVCPQSLRNRITIEVATGTHWLHSQRAEKGDPPHAKQRNRRYLRDGVLRGVKGGMAIRLVHHSHDGFSVRMLCFI